MSSTIAARDAYSYTRPSTAATRSLVDSNPNSNHPSGTNTPSNPASPHGTLHRHRTNNYETAVTDRLTTAVASGTDEETQTQQAQTPPVVHAGLAYRGDASAAQQPVSGHAPSGPVTNTAELDAPSRGSSRPHMGLFGRQQSWKQGDQKRAQMERMLSSDGRKGGYSTGQPPTPA